MAAVQKRQLLPEKILGNGLVRHQHKILDQAGRPAALIGPHFKRPPLLVQKDLALREIKVDRSPLPAARPQKTGQAVHFAQHIRRPAGFLACFYFSLQDLLHLRIAHSPVYTDHRFFNPVGNQRPVLPDLHQAAESQPFRARIQRTDTV